MIEYLSGNMWLAWALVAVACLIVELSAGDFFVMCFAIGAAVTALVAPVGGWYVQLAVFAAASALCVFFVRPFALRYLHRHDEGRVSNADALIGKEGRVTELIPAGGAGRVSVGGDDWKAVSVETTDLAVGTPIRVVDRDSVVVKVEKR